MEQESVADAATCSLAEYLPGPAIAAILSWLPDPLPAAAATCSALREPLATRAFQLEWLARWHQRVAPKHRPALYAALTWRPLQGLAPQELALFVLQLHAHLAQQSQLRQRQDSSTCDWSSEQQQHAEEWRRVNAQLTDLAQQQQRQQRTCTSKECESLAGAADASLMAFSSEAANGGISSAANGDTKGSTTSSSSDAHVSGSSSSSSSTMQPLAALSCGIRALQQGYPADALAAVAPHAEHLLLCYAARG